MKVEILCNLKGNKGSWGKGDIFDSNIKPIPQEILLELKLNTDTVRILEEEVVEQPIIVEQPDIEQDNILDNFQDRDQKEISYYTSPVHEEGFGLIDGISAEKKIEEKINFSTRTEVLQAKKSELAEYLGLTKMEDGETLLYNILEKIKKPIVIDADGLNILAGNKKFAKRFNQPVILTPHPGEMARLSGLTIPEIQGNRIEVARRFAGEWQVYLILKGAHTVLATPDGRIFINPTGNAGMAAGGTGDVLTGIIGGLLAQGLPPIKALQTGAYIHGLAGDRIRAQKGEYGLLATDLIDNLPQTIKEL